MKLIIEITKENKDKIFQLIDILLEGEKEITPYISKDESEELSKTLQTKQLLKNRYLAIPASIPHLKSGLDNFLSKQNDVERAARVGSWGQFNSFFPIKASLRVLANLLRERNTDSIRLDEFVKICINVFQEKGYQRYRGFPISKKDTARGRFVWHFLDTAYEMGLIDIKKSELDYRGMPNTLQDWDKVFVAPTKEGLEFALIKNQIFDSLSDEQVLTEEEKNWLISHLKRIDELGYREYSLLRRVYDFLKQGHDGKEDLRNWFINNRDFVEYVKSWSRKAQRGDEKALKGQIRNLSITFAGSKVALLRELNIVMNKRNKYTIIGELD